ncbi:hypothetical protein LCGC14_0436940 [marine sediment metagenome]|uniref:Uncharacterized protein n=1 Tax=marine sediment metagenome TaxID=412755 RepID=A0A0F9SLI0_9ZZZZ
MSSDDWNPRSRWGLGDLMRRAFDRIQRIADLRREIASQRPAHISEAFHAAHVAAAQASLDRLLDTDTDTDTDTRRGSDEDHNR